MQLKKKSIASSLAAATCSLLGAAPGLAVAEEQPKRWEFDTAVMYYGESARVTDVSGNFLAVRNWVNGRVLQLKLTVDSLTGASGSGATPTGSPQTFTSPSGNASYTTPAGENPLDPTFLDTRIATSANWLRPLGNRYRIDLGVSASSEYDYLHTGVNARIARDLNGRNTTFSAGLAVAADQIDPVGGAPMPLAAMLPEGDLSNKLGDDDKTVVDLLLGVSHVLGRRTIGQLNYAYSMSDGYLTDPYKIVSVVDPVTGDPAPDPGGLNLYRYESRPDSRAKHSLFAQARHMFDRDIIDLSYRFMTDDWGIQSHTLDLRYKWKWWQTGYLEPHVRYYMQSAADFYVYSLLDGAPLPTHATADYRLGEFDAMTVGLKYGRPLGGRREWSIRLEYYQQSGESSPAEAVGSQANFDLFPTVDALIGQVGFKF